MKKLIKKLLIKILSQPVVLGFCFDEKDTYYHHVQLVLGGKLISHDFQVGFYDMDGKLIKKGKVVWE